VPPPPHTHTPRGALPARTLSKALLRVISAHLLARPAIFVACAQAGWGEKEIQYQNVALDVNGSFVVKGAH